MYKRQAFSFGKQVIYDKVNLALPNPAGLIFTAAMQQIKDRIVPVSYTHLDVYKRQTLSSVSCGWARKPNTFRR